MPALKRSDLAAPELPRETVAVPALGGDVIVRGLRLSERLALFAGLRTDADGRSYDHIAKLLAATVVDDDGAPLLTEAEWEAFGGRHFEAVLALFGVARRLAGLDAEVIEKN